MLKGRSVRKVENHCYREKDLEKGARDDMVPNLFEVIISQKTKGGSV